MHVEHRDVGCGSVKRPGNCGNSKGQLTAECVCVTEEGEKISVSDLILIPVCVCVCACV